VSSLAPLLEGFFTERLLHQRQASPHTVAAYRDTFRLLLGFVHRLRGKAPVQLELHDLDAVLIGTFLEDLETHRHNGARTRNARLAAVHSFFRYAALREPAHSALIQRVLAIPSKRSERAVVNFLTRPEIDALLAAPDRGTPIGRRDYALLLTAIQTGLRVSELTRLAREDVRLGVGAHLRCIGKGRKERCTPLTSQCAAVLRAWLRERARPCTDPLFPSRGGTSLSRDAVEYLVAKAADRAAKRCPSLRKKHVSPHVLRHTTAMQLLNAGIDRAVIALWLGHESVETTQIYLHADLSIKERALALTTPVRGKPGRYHPPDPLLAFLESL
jgi:integrase/recombinase XerD